MLAPPTIARQKLEYLFPKGKFAIVNRAKQSRHIRNYKFTFPPRCRKAYRRNLPRLKLSESRMKHRHHGYDTDGDGDGVSAMDVDHLEEDREKEEEDPFLSFVDYARSELLLLENDPNGDGSVTTGYGWSWIVSRILKTCIAYSSGVTPAILLSELAQVNHLSVVTYFEHEL